MSGDVRLEQECAEDSKMNNDQGTGELATQVEALIGDISTTMSSSQSKCLLSIGDVEQGLKDVTLTTEFELMPERDYIAELKKEISQLQVELRFMHEENDTITREHKEKVIEITGELNQKMRTLELSLSTAEQKNDQLKKDFHILTGKYESKCDQVLALETAQTNFETLVKNKDEIIESQKCIIKGVRKQVLDYDSLKSQLAEATQTIKEKNTELEASKSSKHLSNVINSSENKDLEVQLAYQKDKNSVLSEKLADITLISERTMLAYNAQKDPHTVLR